jgi:hypothetical protein
MQVIIVLGSIVMARFAFAQGPGSGIHPCHTTEDNCLSGCPTQNACCCCHTALVYRCRLIPDGYANCAQWGLPTCYHY